MAGHIQLGLMADETLRDYALIDIERYQCASANPFTARISTGGKYAELDNFSDWTIQDWHSGVGNNDPEAGPLFSMAETRFPGYLMPPYGWEYPAYNHVDGITGDGSIAPGTLEPLSTKRYATSFTATKSGDIDSIWVFIHCPSNYETTVALFDDDGFGKPDNELDTADTISEQTRIHAHWVRHGLGGAVTLTSGTRYHIVVTTNVAATLSSGITPYMPTVDLGVTEKCHVSTSGGAWSVEPTSSGAAGFGYLMTFSEFNTDACKGVFAYGGSVWAWLDDEIYKIVAGDFVSKVSGITIYDVLQIDNVLYVSYGAGYKIYDMTDDSLDDFTADSYMMKLHSGFLWRSIATTISYTADEVTWTDLPEILGTNNVITGMAGLEREMYFTTREGLYVAVAGDEILSICPWPEAHDDNGKGMLAWEGALYIPLFGGAIMRYDTSGALLNVGINAKEQLPPDIQGTVTHLKATNYFLMAVVNSTDTFDYSSLWSYNVDGWHCLSLAPGGGGGGRGGAICVDRDNDYLYWGMNRAIIMRTKFPGNVNNPARFLDTLTLAPESWIEYDRFYGSNHTLDKDIDRIFIDTENAGRKVHVYWQDDENYAEYTDNHDGTMGWQYLGTVAAGETTIQFPPTARPGGKSFRLALRIATWDTNDTTEPIVRGLSIKFSTNVTDRWRWVLPLAVHDNQQFPDGSVNPYTADEMLAHLDSLKNDTAPLQYRDIDGTTYYVKVTAASRQVARYQWQVGNEAPDIQWIYVFNLEEMS